MKLPEEISTVLTKAKMLYSKGDIENSLDKMAQEISAKVANKNPVLLCVVLGGIVTMGNLLPRLDFPLELDYIHLGRYGKKMVGSKKITWHAEPRSDLKNRTVVIVDDILDEGFTLAAVVDYCRQKGARQILTAVLVDKKKKRAPEAQQDADFKGLQVEDGQYIFGYGLDYQEYLRNAPGIYSIAEEHQW